MHVKQILEWTPVGELQDAIVIIARPYDLLESYHIIVIYHLQENKFSAQG